MEERLLKYVVNKNDGLLKALAVIDANKLGCVVVLDNEKVVGALTDGDIRRWLVAGESINASVFQACTKKPKTVLVSDNFDVVVELFKNQAIKFLPIVNKDNELVNLITKSQMHSLLLQDISANLTYDFLSLDTAIIDQEIFPRPWGYYKTTVLNDYFQSKIISVKPLQKLSLQSHNRREEYWTIAHGTGLVQLDDTFQEVTCGSTVYIPKGCKHRVTNTDEKESLIITEVQIGDYFGEDDIVRYEDIYGRK